MDNSTKLSLLSCASGGLFSGAALYINMVEHPARMQLDITQAHQQWKPSYTQAAKIQAILALISSLSSIVNYFKFAEKKSKPTILGGGLLMAFMFPFTLIFIMPVNKTLLYQQVNNEQKLTLLSKWIKLHSVRTAAGLLAFGFTLYALATK